MKYVIMLFLFLASCTNPKISENWEEPLIVRLYNTKWEISQDRKNNRIEFQGTKLKLGIGSILAAPFTDFKVVAQDQNFVILSIYNDIAPRLLGLKLVDGSTMMVSLWEPTVPVTVEQAKQAVDQHGQIYKLQK
ncbi:MAG: hypothetical protein ACRCS8_00845 [Brevinema sp.]